MAAQERESGEHGHKDSPPGPAGLLSLIAIGYGGVISGDFFGWQLSLQGGFWNAFIILGVMSLHYLALSFSVAEIAAALPGCVSPAQFVRDCMGPPWALTVAVAETIKILLVVDVITFGLSSYLAEIFQFDPSWSPLVWFISLSIDGAVLAIGGDVSIKVQLCFTAAAGLLLIIFYIGALATGLHINLALDGDVAGSSFYASTPNVQGFFYALPFGMWWYLGVEELPLSRSLARKDSLMTPAVRWAFMLLMGTALSSSMAEQRLSDARSTRVVIV